MCGLAGMVGESFTPDDVKFFKLNLHANSIRGFDSTGVMMAHTLLRGEDGFPYEIKKNTMHPGRFIDTFGFSEKLSWLHQPATVYLGHTRSATVGKVSQENAHPFDLDKFVGAHNGTLYDYEYMFSPTTDSEALFEDMSKYGVGKTLSRLDYYSAFAISLFIKETGKVLLMRNKQRPLHIGYNKKNKVIHWSSDLRILDFVADMTDTNIERYTLLPFHIYEFDPLNIQGDRPWKCTQKIKEPSFSSSKKSKTVFTSDIWKNREVMYD